MYCLCVNVYCTVLLPPGVNTIAVNKYNNTNKVTIFTIPNDILSSFTDNNGHIFVIFSQKEYPGKLMIELFYFYVLTTVVIAVVEIDQWSFIIDSANFASNTLYWFYFYVHTVHLYCVLCIICTIYMCVYMYIYVYIYIYGTNKT